MYQIDEIRNKILQGDVLKEIERWLTNKCVDSIIKVMKRKLPPSKKIRELYWKEGKSASEIAKIYGVNRGAVYDFMRREGIERRSKKEAINLYILQGKRKKRPLNCKLKKIVRCRKCAFVFKPSGERIRESCPNCGNIIDVRDRTEYVKKYLKQHPERLEKLKKWKELYGKKYKNKSGKNLRKSVLFVIGGKHPKCKYCGCDDIRLLEINHKFGGGTQEYKKKGAKFYWDIIMGRRKVDDLELTCRVCNARHYLEMKYGDLPYKILWKKNEKEDKRE